MSLASVPYPPQHRLAIPFNVNKAMAGALMTFVDENVQHVHG